MSFHRHSSIRATSFLDNWKKRSQNRGRKQALLALPCNIINVAFSAPVHLRDEEYASAKSWRVPYVCMVVYDDNTFCFVQHKRRRQNRYSYLPKTVKCM